MGRSVRHHLLYAIGLPERHFRAAARSLRRSTCLRATPFPASCSPSASSRQHLPRQHPAPVASPAAAAFLAAARGFLANCCSACLRALWSTADALTGSLSVHPGLLYELGIFSLPFRAVPHQNSSAPIIRQPWTFGGSPADCFRSCFPPRPVGALRTPVRHPVCTLGIFSLPFRAVLRQSSSALVLRQPWTFGGSTAGCFWPFFSHYGHELRRSPSGEREFSTRGASLVAYGHSSCSPSLRLSGEPFRAILAAFSWLNSTAGCL